MRLLLPILILAASLTITGCGGGGAETAGAASSPAAATNATAPAPTATAAPATATANPSIAYRAAISAGAGSLGVQFKEIGALLGNAQFGNATWRDNTIAKADEITRTAQSLRDAKAPSTPEWQQFEQKLDASLEKYLQAMPLVKAGARTGSSAPFAEAIPLITDAQKGMAEATAIMPKD
ncbi:MAG: hypothetical protein IT302_16005 [Dehalococcoidia bacterium]|nr:hypothetical protein [Dehalococcoidia bacterium]